MKRVHLFVRGRVQGVFFRVSTRDEGWRLGLHGWVRNLPDGRVEIVAEGEESALQRLIDWAHHGPPDARVDEVTLSWEEPTGTLDGFRVTR